MYLVLTGYGPILKLHIFQLSTLSLQGLSTFCATVLLVCCPHVASQAQPQVRTPPCLLLTLPCSCPVPPVKMLLSLVLLLLSLPLIRLALQILPLLVLLLHFHMFLPFPLTIRSCIVYVMTLHFLLPQTFLQIILLLMLLPTPCNYLSRLHPHPQAPLALQLSFLCLYLVPLLHVQISRLILPCLLLSQTSTLVLLFIRICFLMNHITLAVALLLRALISL